MEMIRLKKLLSQILVIILLFSSLPLTSLADYDTGLVRDYYGTSDTIFGIRPAFIYSESEVQPSEFEYTCQHRFINTSTDYSHLKSEATCLEPALYYLSCVYCEATCTEAVLCEYYYICSVCGEHFGKTVEYMTDTMPALGHVDADNDGICERCGEEAIGKIIILGDVNGDGKIRANDARKILRASAELEDPKTWEALLP